MKQIFTILVALLATTNLWAYDYFQYGELYYYITSYVPYTVEVTYQELYSPSNYSDLTSVTIPETVTYEGTTYSVTRIGDGAFEYCSALTSITIPNSVTSIGYHAFYKCRSLTSVTISNSVTSIEHGAFGDCSALTSVIIPNSVTSIGEYAFNGCSSLTSITIPNSVTSIGSRAFVNCDDLISIVVDSGNSTYDSRENCNAIIETATNTLIVGCKNTTFPNSVTSIGDAAFGYCSSLTSVIIPNSVTSIGERAFYYCSALTSIVVESGNSTYDSRENCNAIIETATNTLIAGCQNTIIPNSVTSIGIFAFEGCKTLTSITIPNNVTSIGYWAFAWCWSLKTVICEAIEVPELLGGDVFYDVFYDMPLSRATLYVPAQSLDDYKAAEQWKEFGTILPIEETSTGVENTYNPSSTADTNKLIRDGQVIIVRGGKSYSVMGQELY